MLNLDNIGKLEAPVAYLGGAGSFGAIFLAGILALLLSVLIV